MRRRRLFRPLAIVAILAFGLLDVASAQESLAPAPDGSFDAYHWSISLSSTNPLVNSGTPTGGSDTVYLWLCRVQHSGVSPCFHVEGVKSAKFGLSASGDLAITGLTPVGGVTNLGSATCPELVMPECSGPTLAAEISILSLTGGICIVPCDEGGGDPVKGVEDCAEPGVLRDMEWTGLDLGSGPCHKGALGCFGHVDTSGACCFSDGSCFMSDACSCLLAGGDPQGFGSDCYTQGCAPVSTQPTTWGRTKSLYRE